MALLAFISVKGKAQGQFKGEATQTKRKGNWIPVLSFDMGVKSPRDAVTGQATGKRQYRPVSIIKEWGAASPQGLTACATNEDLSEVAIEFTKTNPNGEEYVYQTVTLTDAMMVEVERFTRAQDGTLLIAAGPTGTLELEKWSFSFRKIQVDDKNGKTSFADDWEVSV